MYIADRHSPVYLFLGPVCHGFDCVKYEISCEEFFCLDINLSVTVALLMYVCRKHSLTRLCGWPWVVVSSLQSVQRSFDLSAVLGFGSACQIRARVRINLQSFVESFGKQFEIHFVLIDNLKLKTHCTFLLSEVDTRYYFLSFKSQEHFQLMINMNTAHLVICFYALL